MKMVSITLLATCMIAGVPRSPVEGVQTVPEDDAERLIDSGMAELADEEDAFADLDTKTVEQLRAIAHEHEIDLEGKTKKADIIAAIRANYDAGAEQE